MVPIMEIIEQRIFYNGGLQHVQNTGDPNLELHFLEFVSILAKFSNVKNRAIPYLMHSFIEDPDKMVLVDEESLKETRYKAENDDQNVDDGNYMGTNNSDDDDDDEKNDDKDNEKNDDENNDDENNEKNDDENRENDNDDEIIIISD